MKHKLLVRTLFAAIAALPISVMAEEADCFPMCAVPVKVEIAIDAANAVATPETAIDDTTSASCDSGFIKQAEDLNAKVKPIREIVGYVRSPQGLAIKLVNDHIVKIPAWVGYAMDPIGSIKRRAIEEVRTQVKSAMDDGKACAVPASDVTYPAMDIYVGHSV